MHDAPPITVIIVAYNAGAFLQPCINALAAQTHADFEAVIVDNASTDGAVDALDLPDDRFRIDRPGENLGFAAANNRVAGQSQARWIALLNPDTQARPDWLEQLLHGTQRWPDCPAFGSTQVQLDAPDRLDGAGDAWFAGGVGWRALEGRPVSALPTDGETFAPCAAAALYDRAVFVDAGGFDERFFCYCEDLDFGFRLRHQGHICVQLNDAVVEHAGSGTTGRHSEFTLFHGHRNRIWVFFKNTPLWGLIALTPVHIAVNLYLLLRADAETRAILIRAYSAAWRGLRSVLYSRKHHSPASPKLWSAMTWSPFLVSQRGAKMTSDKRRPGQTPHEH